MGIIYDEKKATFEAVVYEDEIVGLRDFLQQQAPEALKFDFSGCDDVHLGVLQLVMAYQKVYNCTFDFGNNNTKIYTKVLKGFDTSENHCY